MRAPAASSVFEQLGAEACRQGGMHGSARRLEEWEAPDTKAARSRWREARVFERQARRLLARERCAFLEWLLLRTLCDCEGEPWDGVSQIELARRAGLSRQVASYWLIRLDRRGVVERAEGENGFWGVLLTEKGVDLVRRCDERLVAGGLSR
jgi:DNA-binding MarR family transcriptional regulator